MSMKHVNGTCSDDNCFCQEISSNEESSSATFTAYSQFNESELHTGYDDFDSNDTDSDMDRSSDSDYDSSDDSGYVSNDDDMQGNESEEEFWYADRIVSVFFSLATYTQYT